MSIEIIDKLKAKNNGNFKLIDLCDIDYDGNDTNAKEIIDEISNLINYISPTTFEEFVDMISDGGIFYVLSRNISIEYEEETYSIIGLYDVRIHSNGINCFGFNKLHQILINSDTKEITNFTSLTKYIIDKIPSDASKLNIVDEEGNFTSDNVEGALNEVSEQLDNIANEDLVIGEDGKLYIEQGDGTKKGIGVELPTGGNVDLSNYVEKVEGKGLSTNDYTTAEKNKLANLSETGVSNEQVNNAVNTYLQNNPISIDDMWSDLVEGEIYNVKLPPKQTGISVVFTQGDNVVYEDNTLDSLKGMLVVRKLFDDDSKEITTDYTLSGTLTVGTSTITVTSGNYRTTFNVTVSEKPQATLTSISAVYTQGDTIVYPSTNLDDLKVNLVVTATYSDDTTASISNYTLSGTLTVGTSTITVTCEDKIATFEVVVTKESGYVTQNLAGYYDLTQYANGYTGDINDLSGNNMPMKMIQVSSGLEVAEYNPSKTDRVGFVDGKFMCNPSRNVGNGTNTYSVGLYIPNNTVFTTYPFTVEIYAHLRVGYKPSGNELILDSGRKYTATYQGVIMNTQQMLKDKKGSGLFINAIDGKFEMKGNTNKPLATGTFEDLQIDGNTDATPTNKYHHIVAGFDSNKQTLYCDGVKIIDDTQASIKISSSTRDMVFFINSGSNLFADVKLIRVYKNKILTEAEVVKNYNDVIDNMGGVA